jgi:predicted RNA polymerase sigma factor
LLEQLGRFAEAAAEFERAAGLTENARLRLRLKSRAEAARVLKRGTDRGGS